MYLMINQPSSRTYCLAITIRFLAFFTISAASVAAVLYLFAYQRFNLEQDKLQHTESLRLELAFKIMSRDLDEVVLDLRRLSQWQILQDYLEDDTPKNRLRLQNEFLNFAKHKAIYDQVRYIDRTGREQVRVNFNNGTPAAIQGDRLQDKSDRYYFRATIPLAAGQVYLSPLDLNVENETIEQPYKPMIRAAMPLFDHHSGEPKGILVLNYLASYLLAHFGEVMADSWGNAMILNKEGYWLLGPEPQDEWGFMWHNEHTFAQRYPDAWHSLNDTESGTFRTSEGQFSFVTLRPRQITGLVGTGDEENDVIWRIVSRISPEKLAFSPWRTIHEHTQVVIGMTLLTGVLSFLLAWLRTANIHKAKALRMSEERFRELVEQAPDGIFVADLDGRYTDVNTAGCRMLGYVREEIVGKMIVDVIPPEDVERLWQSKEQLLQGGIQVAEWSLLRKDGSYLPVEVSAGILPDGRWQGFVRDISERKQTEEQLRQSATVFNNTMEAILITDAERRIMAVNPAYTNITGFEPEDVLGRDPHLQRSGRHNQEFYQELWQSLEQTGQWQGEIWNRRKNGELYPAWENISVVRDKRGVITNYISVLSDISPIKQAEARLSHLAHHDALTELPNRLAFSSNLELALERAKRHRQKLALLLLDLDRFKLINDTLGHVAGDRLLQVISERLKHSVRAEDMAARLGGDEFTIILEEISHAEDAAALARKINHAVVEPVNLNGHDVVTSASIGISIYPDDADSAGGLARAADAAMYRAKGRGRNTYEFYTAELTSIAIQRFSTESGLRQALVRNEFMLYYQPQVELATGRMLGVEALLRWQHPELGMLLPENFIGVAEESDLIDAIGNWVLQTALAQARIWRKAGMPPLRVAVNLSGRQVMYDHTVDAVRNAMEQNGLKPGDVLFELEVTENVLQSGELIANRLRQLQQLGFSIAIDDFGTGYSSLSHLKHLPIDTLKIDRVFLRNVPQDSDNKEITTAIISMGHSLGMRVVAEGVEGIEQLDFLRAQGCDEIQGFLISEAVSAEHIGFLLERNQPFTFEARPIRDGTNPDRS